MKKILLIEDRSQRQQDFLQSSNINLSKYSDILDNKIDNEYEKFMLTIKSNNYNLNPYDVIIAHESIFVKEYREVLGKIQNYCRDNNKTLVLFSGGNETSYSCEDYEVLHLSSEEFYSKNLILFLEDFIDSNINIRILTFGKQWKLNIILNTLENINIFIGNNKDEDIDYDDFANKTKINLMDNLDIKFYEMEKEDNWVYLNQIIKLRDSMLTIIKEMVNE